MLRRFLTLLPLALMGAAGFHLSPLRAQDSSQARFQEARTAWDAGRFVEALEIMEGLLLAPEGGELVRDIALLTGEIHPVTEVSSDGRAVRWSPDGRFAAYESGSGSEGVTHVLELAGTGLREVSVIQDRGLVFSPVGDRAAYLTVPESPELDQARARIEAEFGGTDRTARMRLRSALAELEAQYTRVVVVDLASGSTETLETSGVGIQELLFDPAGDLFFVGTDAADAGVTKLFGVSHGGTLVPTAESADGMDSPFFAAGGRVLVYGTGRGSFAVLDLDSGLQESFLGVTSGTPALSGDGNVLGFLSSEGEETEVHLVELDTPSRTPRMVARLPMMVSGSSSRSCPGCPVQSGMALSHDGQRVVIQGMPREDWELFLLEVPSREGEAAVTQLTREIQHDLYPTFLPGGRLLAMKGEGRHRRSHLYDLNTGQATWLFRNNTVRTVAPEYEWAPSPDGRWLLLVAERDGNTVSPERGVYIMDLGQEVGREEILARVRENLAAERDLRARAEAMFGPLSGDIETVLAKVSMSRIFADEEALFQFGSKYVTEPGNRMAIDYIVSELEEAGYAPELQWFDARGAESANVIARIPGTESPDVVYAVSAHFDSNRRSPGADDNTSATVGLLEMARVLKDHPLPATVEIALFTGEEAGLLGSREYVRRAVESGKTLVGALNNDMVGYAEDHRLDNTIRYSNKGIRDLQHGAALLFTDLVLHDAEYYKSTDAAAYYDAYGDIVGGIGSYPILASPHYHQSHDVLETINHRLVTEVAKTTVASAMLMASSPSRLKNLLAERDGPRLVVSWDPAVERDVKEYRVVWGPQDGPSEGSVTVTQPTATLRGVRQDWVVSVKAVNDRGLEGWDWATIPAGG